MTSLVIKEFPVEEEYKKDIGICPEDIHKLRQWLQTQPHLPKDHITDLDLIQAYHSCECSAEVTKQVIDLHYTLRTLFTPLFKDRFFNDRIELVLNKVFLKVLPTRTKEGYAVFYSCLLDTDPKNFYFSETVRAVLMILDLWQRREGTWPGFVLVFDLAGMKLGHLAKIDLQTIQQFLYYLQEAMLVKVKGLHYTSAPSFMDRVMSILKPFMKKDLLDVLRIHQIGSRTLDEFVPMDALPKDAGGKYKSYEECNEESISIMKANKEFFVEENKKRVVEALRPGKPKTITDIFGGVVGSFKQLDID